MKGNPENLSRNLKTKTGIEEIFRRAQKVFNVWSELPPPERTAAAILKALDFDFFEVLDAVTIARSRKHIETFYDTKDIGKFPQRRKPLSYQCPHHPSARRAGAQRHLQPTVGAQARRLRSDQLHSAEPPS